MSDEHRAYDQRTIAADVGSTQTVSLAKAGRTEVKKQKRRGKAAWTPKVFGGMDQ
jgi:hypothetical protein